MGMTDPDTQADLPRAPDLESGEAAAFGSEGLDHIPISKAVQATTALPGLYLPVEIEGRAYVDGILLKTMHASVALEAGAELVLCINPVVPVDTRPAVLAQELEENPVLRQGLPSVLSQPVRTMIHSRMAVVNFKEDDLVGFITIRVCDVGQSPRLVLLNGFRQQLKVLFCSVRFAIRDLQRGDQCHQLLLVLNGGHRGTNESDRSSGHPCCAQNGSATRGL